MPRSGWPTSPCLRLDCRTGLEAGEVCDGGRGHRAVDLRRKGGAELVRLEVWGHPIERMRARQRPGRRLATLRHAAVLGAALALAGGTLVFVAPLVAGLLSVVFLASLLGARAVGWLRAGARARPLLPPAGARWPPPDAPRGVEVVRGVVVTPAVEARTPPMGGEPMLAYALWAWAAGELTLEAATLEFELVADDGRRIRVPAGRCRFAPAPDPPQGPPPERLRAYAEARDENRDREFPGVPDDRCAVAQLSPGRAVCVAAAFERTQVVSPGRVGDYRTAPAQLWIARGAPMLSLDDEP